VTAARFDVVFGVQDLRPLLVADEALIRQLELRQASKVTLSSGVRVYWPDEPTSRVPSFLRAVREIFGEIW